MCKVPNEKIEFLPEVLTDEDLCRLVAEGNRQAEEILAARYIRLVRTCARPYFLAGGDSEDLTQEGMLGFIKAVREFNGNKDASFRTFAEICIRSRLYSALRSAGREKHQVLNQSVSLDTPTLTAIPTPLAPIIWRSATLKMTLLTGNIRQPSYPVSGNSCPNLKRRSWGTI